MAGRREQVRQPAGTGPDDLATIREACKFLRIGRTLFWKVRKNNQIPAVLIGERVLFRWSDLKAIAKNGATTV